MKPLFVYKENTVSVEKFLKANKQAEGLLSYEPFVEDTVTRIKASLFPEFACERMAAFYARQRGYQYRSKFSTINQHRYTNPYRILDRVSQALVSKIALNDEYSLIEKAFLCYLFRVANKPETYDKILSALGSELDLSRCTDDEYLNTLVPLIRSAVDSINGTVFRIAYKKCTDVSYFEYYNYIQVFAQPEFERAFLSAKRLSDYFALMMPVPKFGPFLSYQLALDWNYCRVQPFEIDFVVPGPGARKGCSMVFGSEGTAAQIARIKLMTRMYQEVLPYWMDYETQGRRLALMENDMQNIFCEYSKFFAAHVFKDKPKRVLDTMPTAIDIRIPQAYIELSPV